MKEKKILRNEGCPQKRVEIIESGVNHIYEGKPVSEYVMNCYDEDIRSDEKVIGITFYWEGKEEPDYDSREFQASFVYTLLERFFGDYQETTPEAFVACERIQENIPYIKVNFTFGKCSFYKTELVYGKDDVTRKNTGYMGIAKVKKPDSIEKGALKEGYVGLNLVNLEDNSKITIKKLTACGDDSRKTEELLGELCIKSVNIGRSGMCNMKAMFDGHYDVDTGSDIPELREKMKLKTLDLDSLLEMMYGLPKLERFLMANSENTDYILNRSGDRWEVVKKSAFANSVV